MLVQSLKKPMAHLAHGGDFEVRAAGGRQGGRRCGLSSLQHAQGRGLGWHPKSVSMYRMGTPFDSVQLRYKWLNSMVYGRYHELVNGVSKPTYNWGAPSWKKIGISWDVCGICVGFFWHMFHQVFFFQKLEDMPWMYPYLRMVITSFSSIFL